MSNPNFEVDSQALFGFIDLYFSTNVNMDVGNLKATHDLKSQELYIKLSEISRDTTTLVLASISDKYIKYLENYFSRQGLELFIHMTIDFKIKEILSGVAN